jgi:hypothetical protein
MSTATDNTMNYLTKRNEDIQHVWERLQIMDVQKLSQKYLNEKSLFGRPKRKWTTLSYVILCGFMLTLVKNTTADLFQPTEPTTNK